MATTFGKPTLAQRVLPLFQGFDGWLVAVILLLAAAGLLAMYSSGYDHGTRFADHGRNMLIAVSILFVVAQIPPQKLMAMAVPLYALGVALLVAVALFGITKKGAQRWINLGIVIQPSELLKIGMPLMLAWWFQKREGQLRPLDFGVAALLLAVPVGLIMKQPDLGTSLLVLAAGLSVIFFAGLPWKLVRAARAAGGGGRRADRRFRAAAVCRRRALAGAARLPAAAHLHLARPDARPAGQGLSHHPGHDRHRLGRACSARASWQGTQTHLEFIPERTTDFIFAAFSEEFGLLGNLFLIVCFLFLVWRGLAIAMEAATLVFAPAGGRGDHDLLHLCLCQHGHGQRHSCRWWGCRCRLSAMAARPW